MLNWIIYFFVFTFSVLCFVFSFKFHQQKWGNLIAGYNDLSKKERAAVDFKAVSQSASKSSFITGTYLLFMLFFIYSILENTIETSMLRFSFSIVSLAFLIFIVNETRKSNKLYRSDN
ncbi:DUF3784 domain-containing protein [Enterococcus gilvus]|uniref:DUF3784 domain-containing protein n=1 Tax=Enterococcus gilvus TaxID=160453 RepID=UPI003ED8F977